MTDKTFSSAVHKSRFELLYKHYNSRKWVHPDPLEFLYDYPDLRDREIIGLIASSLAYGRVSQILKSVAVILDEIGPSPAEYLQSASSAHIRSRFNKFKHRFTTGREIALFLQGIKLVIKKFGSLQDCFLSSYKDKDESILPALCFFVKELRKPYKNHPCSLLPLPEKGSACKRLHLFMRWMVRKDMIDPGGWNNIATSRLIIPLDTHMYRIGNLLDFSSRKSADIRTALEITRAFGEIVPEDPVKYDFALTRLGIRDDASINQLIDTKDTN